MMSIWSTPAVPINHARQLIRMVDRCQPPTANKIHHQKDLAMALYNFTLTLSGVTVHTEGLRMRCIRQAALMRWSVLRNRGLSGVRSRKRLSRAGHSVSHCRYRIRTGSERAGRIRRFRAGRIKRYCRTRRPDATGHCPAERWRERFGPVSGTGTAR
jgi:hypothetical protein